MAFELSGSESSFKVRDVRSHQDGGKCALCRPEAHLSNCDECM